MLNLIFMLWLKFCLMFLLGIVIFIFRVFLFLILGISLKIVLLCFSIELVVFLVVFVIMYCLWGRFLGIFRIDSFIICFDLLIVFVNLLWCVLLVISFLRILCF